MGKVKSRGRPKKQSKKSINTGRKPSLINESSRSTIRRRAQEIVDNPRYNIRVLELAIKILNNRSTDNEELMEVEEDQTNQYRHTNESALALSLEFNLSKEAYKGIAKDLKNRNCNILMSYDTMSKSKQICKPLNYSISEVYLTL